MIKKVCIISFLGVGLVSGLGSVPLEAAVPPMGGQVPANGLQQSPGAWEFRPPRETPSMTMGQENFPRRNYQYNYGYQQGWPGPMASFFGQRLNQQWFAQPRNQWFGLPQKQGFGQPQGQWFGQPKNQWAGPPQGQGFGQPQNQWVGQSQNQGFGRPQNQWFEQSRNQGASQRQQPSYGTPYQSRQSSEGPRIEVSLSDNRPYAQQATIYTLRVVSDSNIQTIDVNLPKSNDVVFQKLDGPNASVRNRRGVQEIVNEFHYTLTPLRDGYIELPPVRVTGTMAPASNGYMNNRSGQTFDSRARRGLRLRVRPADPSVQPWLPLQQLSLRAGLDGADEVEAGKPLTLWIEMSAVGATGAQLPSLERQLKSQDFRVYREKTNTRSELSADGRYLHGVRTEYFTLVPQRGGKLRLPPVRIAWWDVNNDTKQYASLPVKPLDAGGQRSDGFFSGLIPSDTLFPAGSPSVFWVPVAGFFGLLLGYWLAVWLRGRRGLARQPLIPGMARLRKPAAAAFGWMSPTLARLSPRASAVLGRASRTVGGYLEKARQKLVYVLPRSLRFWFCMRRAADEDDPGSWRQTLMLQASQHLNLRPQSPLPQIGERLVELQPRTDPNDMRELMRALDGAIYGSESLDFPRWKQEFMRQIRPRIVPVRRHSRIRARRYLPELNPTAA